jgi:hypothetical protein
MIVTRCVTNINQVSLSILNVLVVFKKLMIGCVLAYGLLANAAYGSTAFALIQAVKGKVLVNKGNGYEQVSADMAINIGDSLLISRNSSVTLNYVSGGCSSSLSSPSLVKVGASVPCSSAQSGGGSGSASGANSIGRVSGAATGGSSSDGGAWSVPNIGGTSTTSTPITRAVSLP